jgi:RNA polymerase sigma-70 factor (ECF subfamily)
VYYTGSTDVEDLVQETFLRAVRQIHKCLTISNPKAWLCQIARRLAIDAMRRNKRRDAFLDWFRLRQRPADPYELVEAKDSVSAILKLLQSMNQNYRDVLVLRGVYDFSAKETAMILGWTTNRVNVTYHRAIQAIREQFGRHGEGLVQ